jgi:sRNA-binding regulator protein Hfq
MKPNESSLTLRQRYEAGKVIPAKSSPKKSMGWNDDSFLGELVGCRITVTFTTGEETSGIFKAFDRYAIKLDHGLVVLKHSVRSVRPTGERNVSTLAGHSAQEEPEKALN